MTTTLPKVAELARNRKWLLIDATDKILGRLASRIVLILRGKHKPTYTPFLDTGDFVVVVNSARVLTTGKKREQKQYHFHSGYQGGLRTVTMDKLLDRTPNKVIEMAVWGMLPKTTMGRHMLKRMKVYSGPDHPHQAQLAGNAPGEGASDDNA